MYGMKFSMAKLKSCLVKDSSSSMDRFLNSVQQKDSTSLFAPGALYCLHGRPGCGKSTYLAQLFPVRITIDPDVFKTKQGTLDFFERLRGTRVPIIVDDWEAVCDLVGVREIEGPISLHSPTILVAHAPIKNVQCIEMPNQRDFRRDTLDDQGNSAPDMFESPKDYVHRLLRGEWKNVRIGDVTHEHGHVWSIVQENYPDRVKSLDTLAQIAEYMSEADLIDTDIYDTGEWNIVMPLFTSVSCIRPCQLMEPSKKVPRTGSFWTKHQNMCMRQKKLDTMFRRHVPPLTIDALHTVVKAQFEKEDYSSCVDYSMDPADIDVLGHIIGPFKPKILSAAKKIVSLNK